MITMNKTWILVQLSPLNNHKKKRKLKNEKIQLMNPQKLWRKRKYRHEIELSDEIKFMINTSQSYEND